jgi:glutathione peroxidase
MDNTIPFDTPLKTLTGETTTLGAYRGKVVLVVNVASQCGFTGQYDGLEALYQKYQDRGFVVLGFPCNQFLFQEPGDADKIQTCGRKYNVTFPVFEKIKVNGPSAHPIYQWLKRERPGFLGTSAIKWNFTKFLVDRNGAVVQRYGSATAPEKIAPEIERLLA